MTVRWIGNALDAAAWRLAGARVVTIDAAGAAGAAQVEQALVDGAGSALVLLDAAAAALLPPERRHAVLARAAPLTLLVEAAGAPPSDDAPAQRVRRQLGMASPP